LRRCADHRDNRALAPDAVTRPKVSVCVPAFNAEGRIGDAVRSVLDQTFEDFELIVVDNASEDATRATVEAFDDPRINLYSNAENTGHNANWNRVMGLARAPYLKLLCADDVLYPDCLATMLRVIESDAGVGFAFARRDIVLEDPTDAEAIAFKERFEEGDRQLGELGPVNRGRALFDRWVADGLGANWVGEPTSIMLRRDCLRRTGTFSRRVLQKPDMELWLRLMFFFDVGFVPTPLTRYVVHSKSVTAQNRSSGAAWLDDLWLLEGLLGFAEIRTDYPQLGALRRGRVATATRHAAHCVATGRWRRVREMAEYAAFRLRHRQRERASLYGELCEEDVAPAAPGGALAAGDGSSSCSSP
jgi:glycosyltransferase involved in cell wall biosynthesis